jgi:inner membrane protein
MQAHGSDSSPADALLALLQSSRTLKLLGVGALALVLQVPIAMVAGLVAERQGRRDQAAAEVRARWGGEQSLLGPALLVPYLERWSEPGADQATVVRTRERVATFLPEELAVRGRLASERRARGIFSVPVYRVALAVEGRFAPPSFDAWGVSPEDVLWERARLAVGIADARAVQEAAALEWEGEPVAFEPGSAGLAGAEQGMHAPLGRRAQDAGRFAFAATLNGSEGLSFTPFGRTTRVELAGDWPGPSFSGAWLPAEREVRDDGFRAAWRIPYLGRSYGQAWSSDAPPAGAIAASRFGVALHEGVDPYRMSERSVKYARLFVVWTLGVVWLLEALGHRRVHPIQYLLMGGAVCLFFLLELSLSEHLRFGPAYAVASAAVVAALGAYALAVLGRGRPAAALAAVVACLYGYLYVVLRDEDYALLFGSLGLFAALAGVMFLTRRVDWYALPGRGGPEGTSSN